jgi:DNA-directed RNA polymerase subunit RPC12/RpoP
MLTIPEFKAIQQAFKPIKCPHCGGLLNNSFHTVIATRNCPHCGKRVVAEPEGDGTLPFSREQFNAACAASMRATSRLVYVMFAALSWLLLVFFAMLCFEKHPDAPQWLREPGLIRGLVGLGPSVVIALAGLRAFYRTMERHRLRCPRCVQVCSGALFNEAPNLTRLTGNCWNCGQKLLNDSPQEEPNTPLPTAAEYLAACRRANRPEWDKVLLVVLLVAAVLATLFLVLSRMNISQFAEEYANRYGVGASAVVGVTICGWLSIVVGSIILGERWLSRRRLRRWVTIPAINCPHYREKLSAEHFVVTSQRCPACGKRVLANPNAEPVGVAIESANG